jgi:hypothetical protein
MSQVCFNKPDPYKETLRGLKIAERNGQLKDPVAMTLAMKKLKRLKDEQPFQRKVDYNDKGGAAHPLSGDNT